MPTIEQLKEFGPARSGVVMLLPETWDSIIKVLEAAKDYVEDRTVDLGPGQLEMALVELESR